MRARLERGAAGAVVALLVGVVPVDATGATGSGAWVRQFGSENFDAGLDVVIDRGGPVTVLACLDPPPTSSCLAPHDALVLRRYGRRGGEHWTTPVGGGTALRALRLAAGPDGTMAVGALTDGALLGQSSAGANDAVVLVFDGEGNELWARQFGSADDDHVSTVEVAADGAVYAVGWTHGALTAAGAGGSDAFVRKFDPEGNEVWTRQFGSASDDVAQDVAVGAGGEVYVLGDTSGVLPGQSSLGSADLFLRRYDANGNEVWTRQFGTPAADNCCLVALALAPNGSPYVASSSPEPLSSIGAPVEAVLRRYDHDGNETWASRFRVLPYAEALVVLDVAADARGAYVAGWSSEASGTQTAFVRLYDGAGAEVGTTLLGGPGADTAGIGVDVGGGDVVLVGAVSGSLAGQPSFGGRDAFVARHPAPTPRPSR